MSWLEQSGHGAMRAAGPFHPLRCRGEGRGHLSNRTSNPLFGARPNAAGGGVAIAPAIKALECDGVFPRSVNQCSAQPHHHGNRTTGAQ
jgi:hypothetical protein